LWEQYDWAVLNPPDWEVRVLGPEAAAVKTTLEMTRTDTSGVVVHHYADWSEVWVIEDGRWKLLIARESIEVIG
jgi:mannose-6-phosphate isomerase-like protein (cupin superfamily)